MDQNALPPASEPGSPSPPILASAVQPPPQVVVHCGSGRFPRLLGWLGWLGFGVCLLIVISQSVALRSYFNTTEGVRERFHSGAKFGQDKVAIITVSGAILDGEHVKQQVDRAREDEHVKAIVLRVVSPGGTIAGSDYILHHLQKLRQDRQIPLVVSMGSMAASGGYYVAMAVGDQERSIFAEPTTTTGSIGVIIPHYDVSGLLERYNIQDDSLASHPNKQMLSMTRPMSEEHRQILASYLDAAFVRFKEVVKQGRPVFRQDPESLEQLATGQIFTADQALKHGLIDEIGFIEEALARVIELGRLDAEKTRVVEYQRPTSLLNLPWTTHSRSGRLPGLDLVSWLDLHSPQAYYLATTLPLLMTAEQR